MTENIPAELANNPLVNPPALPYGAPALDLVRTEHFQPAITFAIAGAKARIAGIRDNPEAPTFENTVEALEFSGALLGRVTAIFSAFSDANSSEGVRAIEEDINMAITRHGNDVMMDAALFARIKAVYDARESLTLDAEKSRLLEEVWKGFVRSGALLDATGKDELCKINEQLSALSTKFSQNLLEEAAAYKKVIDNEGDLAGVPERAKAFYRKTAEAEGMPGKWVIKLSPPPMDILSHGENRALREEIWRAISGEGTGEGHDNRGVILDIVRLRHRRAKLLGYETHAAFVLAERMAKTPETVAEFLARNEAAYFPAAKEFVEKVAAFARETDGLPGLQPWDFGFYSRKLKEKTYSLDMESLRGYFDLGKVFEGLRQHAEKLFGIRMEEKAGTYPVFDPAIKVYEVSDKKSGEIIGLFYADYYARPGAKQAGAWKSEFRKRGLEDGENKIPLVTNTCNFPAPSGGKPTLLSLNEMTTVFHEFGHGLHELLGRGNYASLTGTSVRWDFVELPSQLQENWAEQKEVLDTFARHWQTGEAIPADMMQKIRDMKNYGAGWAGLRQTHLGTLDMLWHTTDPAGIAGVAELEEKLSARFDLLPKIPGILRSPSFSHLFSGGYSAGYYSYKWAEVLEADVFEQFEKAGLYNAELAQRLKDTIYSKGGVVEPDALFREMMGRDPDPDALFRREGILPEKEADKAAPKPSAPAPNPPGK